MAVSFPDRLGEIKLQSRFAGYYYMKQAKVGQRISKPYFLFPARLDRRRILRMAVLVVDGFDWFVEVAPSGFEWFMFEW